MNYAIVPMNSTHIDALAGLEKQCFSSPWSAKSLAEELENPLAHFLAAELAGETAGYIGVQEIIGECYITSIAVAPDHRRKGIAQALISAAETGAKERGCDFITLEVRPSNKAAIALYEKNGYEAAGERKNFYTKPQEDALIMTKFFI